MPQPRNSSALEALLGLESNVANNPRVRSRGLKGTRRDETRNRLVAATRAGAPSNELEGLKLMLGFQDEDLKEDPLTAQGLEVDDYRKRSRDAILKGFRGGTEQGVPYMDPIAQEFAYEQEQKQYAVDAPSRQARITGQTQMDLEALKGKNQMDVRKMELDRLDAEVDNIVALTQRDPANAQKIIDGLSQEARLRVQSRIGANPELRPPGGSTQERLAGALSRAKDTIATMKNMKGFNAYFGAPSPEDFGSFKRILPGWMGGGENAWGSDAATFGQYVKQFRSNMSFPELENMRGLGHMSNREFGVVFDAASALEGPLQDEQAMWELRRAYRNIRVGEWRYQNQIDIRRDGEDVPPEVEAMIAQEWEGISPPVSLPGNSQAPVQRSKIGGRTYYKLPPPEEN